MPRYGVTVTARTQLVSSEMAITAKSENRNSPVASGDSPIPENAMIPITVAPSKGIDVALSVSAAASSALFPRAMPITIPSVMTMALSTSIPIAMIRAPRLIRSICIPNTDMKNSVEKTVSPRVEPTTRPARQPMVSISAPTTIATDCPRLTRKLETDSSTTTCCS